MAQTQILGTLPVEQCENPTGFLPTRSWLADDSIFTPRVNRASFHEIAMIVPKHLAPDFEAGVLAGSCIEMHFTQQNAESLRLIVVGDTTVGRSEATINLEHVDALASGVSRQHILLRPTSQHLYLMDMGSTNGTLLNGVLISPSRAYPLGGRDVITLGTLTFTLNIVGIGKSTEADLEQVSERNPFA